MKSDTIKLTSRPLFAVVALVVAFTVASMPMAQALYYNLIRDAYSAWGGVSFIYDNTDANVDACGGAVAANTGSYSWMVDPMTTLTETEASQGYLETFDVYEFAFTRYFLYSAYTNPSSFATYLDLIGSYREAYNELKRSYYEAYSEQRSDAQSELQDGFINNGFPVGAYNAQNDIWYSLYSTSWLANDQYYVMEAGQYGYSTWASYGAPYYGLAVICAAYGEYASSTGSNLGTAVYYNPDAYTVGNIVDYEAMEEAARSIYEWYDDNAEYWNAWSEYYRLTSDYYEG